jgi:hypothetical protein
LNVPFATALKRFFAALRDFIFGIYFSSSLSNPDSPDENDVSHVIKEKKIT